MTALLRYRADLLVRSQRWLAPVLLYAAFVGIGVQAGQPVLDSLGYAAAGLLPVTAWLVQLCVDQEPPAARTVTAAVVGSPRVHLASLLTGLGCAGLLGVAATLVVLLISRPTGHDTTVRVELLPAGIAGLLAMRLLCAAGGGGRRALHSAAAAPAGLVRRGHRARRAAGRRDQWFARQHRRDGPGHRSTDGRGPPARPAVRRRRRPRRRGGRAHLSAGVPAR